MFSQDKPVFAALCDFVFNALRLPNMITKADFSYSLKNVPIPSPASHLKAVIASTEKFLQRARWRCKLFLNPPDPDKKRKPKWGFKTPGSCEQVSELTEFESDLGSLISNLEYSDQKSPFQKQLSKDVNRINKSPNLFITADKTSNVYEIDPDTYLTLVQNNVNKCYKKANTDTVHDINTEAKILTSKLKIADRVEVLAPKDAYVTIKDHKENFPEEIKCRLINPCKTNIGRITKQILERINNEIMIRLNLAQLKNTSSAINWFKNIKNKQDKYLIQIDLVDYYPSVTETLLKKAIEFAETVTNITPLEKDLINHARLSVLYHDDEVWMKSTGLFDVTMGSYDGAQVTDLVGLMLLEKMRETFPEISFALYRDDGLGHHKRLNAQKLEKLKQKLRKFFEQFDLQITVATGLTKVDFLDVTFDILNNSYQPYRKPNDTPLYINKDSNHPAHIIKNTPKAINKRLSEISSTKHLFNESKGIYQNALTNSGHNFTLNYEPITKETAPVHRPPPPPTQPPESPAQTNHTPPPPPSQHRTSPRQPNENMESARPLRRSQRLRASNSQHPTQQTAPPPDPPTSRPPVGIIW